MLPSKPTPYVASLLDRARYSNLTPSSILVIFRRTMIRILLDFFLIFSGARCLIHQMQPTTDWPICHIAGGSWTFELLMKLGSALHSVRPNSGLTPAVTDSTQQRAKSFWRTRFFEPPSRLETEWKSKVWWNLICSKMETEWKPKWTFAEILFAADRWRGSVLQLGRGVLIIEYLYIVHIHKYMCYIYIFTCKHMYRLVNILLCSKIS